MMSLKKDFPIFGNNPGLAFLDNTSTTQKPNHVINGISEFLSHDYANIHRGAYALSERSELLYNASKEKVRKFINAESIAEINYTYNSTYALNLLASSLRKSGKLQKGDKVLLSIVEHHANVVPWLILKEEMGIEVEYVNVDAQFQLDFEDFAKKYTDDVKVVAMTYVSNVTGTIFDIPKLSALLRDETLFIVDASQAVPNFQVDVRALDIDFLFFTGHKVMADTGIGVLYGKKELIKTLSPSFGGGWAINWVKKEAFAPAGLPYRFEPGTPNIVGAVSLLKAFEYMESIGGYETIEKVEQELISYVLEKTKQFGDRIRLIGTDIAKNRVGVFSFAFAPDVHLGDLADMLAEDNICVRFGHHCAEPLMHDLWLNGTIRMSLYIYNDKQDIDTFFSSLERALS